MTGGFLPGNVRPEQLLPALAYGAAEKIGAVDRIGLMVSDAGFGAEAKVSEWRANSWPHLVKGRVPRTFQKLAKALAVGEAHFGYRGRR